MYLKLVEHCEKLHRHIIRGNQLSILECSVSHVLQDFEDLIPLENCICLDFQKYNFSRLIGYFDDVKVQRSNAFSVAISDTQMLPLAIYYYNKGIVDVTVHLSEKVESINHEILISLTGEKQGFKCGGLCEDEFFILSKLANGSSPKELSFDLKIPTKTMYSKISRILQKMKLRSLHDLFR